MSPFAFIHVYTYRSRNIWYIIISLIFLRTSKNSLRLGKWLGTQRKKMQCRDHEEKAWVNWWGWISILEFLANDNTRSVTNMTHNSAARWLTFSDFFQWNSCTVQLIFYWNTVRSNLYVVFWDSSKDYLRYVLNRFLRIQFRHSSIHLTHIGKLSGIESRDVPETFTKIYDFK